MSNTSRREFLNHSARLAALAGVGGAAPFALNLSLINAAAAQTAPADYKALVCIFLFGGNDHFNTVVPFDTESHTLYRNARAPIARERASLIELMPARSLQGRAFGLAPELQPLKPLWDAKRLAVVGNVGPMVEPLNAQQYRAGSKRVPPKLFSHNDQQSIWQASAPEGATAGWGGRMGDLLAANNRNATFTCVSVAGNAVFLSGLASTQYQVTRAGSVPMETLAQPNYLGSNKAAALLQRMMTQPRSVVLQNDHAAVVSRSIAADGQLRAALEGNPALQTAVTADNALAGQLRMVARMMQARERLGSQRQVFFVSLGGFDHHAGLNSGHPPLLKQVADAMANFDATLGEMGLRDQVLTFTASDFGRALLSNGDGSDHGWGGHHFVMGGAVRGGDFFGTMPVATTGTDTDAGQGRLVPTTSVDQYAATLGSWFGVPASRIAEVVPNISNFASANLGFV
jgi:uncharacterized protein (DUF1501 family)